MNAESDLAKIVNKTAVGCGYIPEKDLLIVFFEGCSLAVRTEGGALIFEVSEDRPQ